MTDERLKIILLVLAQVYPDAYFKARRATSQAKRRRGVVETIDEKKEKS